MTTLPALLVALFLLTVAHAQNLPDAPTKADGGAPASLSTTTPATNPRNPVVFHSQIFWPLVAACGTAAVFDAQMSRAYLVTHPTARERQSWLLGPRPGLGRYYLAFSVMDGGVAIVSYKLLHSRRKALRVIGWSMLGGLLYIHTDDDIYQAVH